MKLFQPILFINTLIKVILFHLMLNVNTSIKVKLFQLILNVNTVIKVMHVNPAISLVMFSLGNVLRPPGIFTDIKPAPRRRPAPHQKAPS